MPPLLGAVLDGDPSDVILVQRLPQAQELDAAKKRIVEAARDAKAIIFGVTTRGHAQLMQQVVAELSSMPIFVVSFREPYYISQEVLEAKNVVTLVAGSNVETSIEAVARVLNGQIRPKPIQYVTVSVGNWVDRRGNLGAPVLGVGEVQGARPSRLLNVAAWSSGLDGAAKYLWAYVAGIVGATVSLIMRGSLPGGFLIVRGLDGTLRAGSLSLALAQGAFGALLYSVVGLTGPSMLPWIGSQVGSAPVDLVTGWMPLGFAGGFIGERLLRMGVSKN